MLKTAKRRQKRYLERLAHRPRATMAWLGKRYWSFPVRRGSVFGKEVAADAMRNAEIVVVRTAVIECSSMSSSMISFLAAFHHSILLMTSRIGCLVNIKDMGKGKLRLESAGDNLYGSHHIST